MAYKYLILDLDSTLYPFESGMEQHMDAMIDDFVIGHLNLPPDRVRSVRQKYFTRYGTTIGGLIKHHGINPDEYYRFIHNFDFQEHIHPAPWLKELLNRLAMRKVVFSNSPKAYIGKVLEILGIASCFEGIFDIAFSGYFGKPNPDSYQNVLNHLGADARDCIFVDNSLPNVVNARRLGFTAIWLCENIQKGAGSEHGAEIPGASVVIGDIRELAEIIPVLIQAGDEASRSVS